jgi:hypothetical protein
MGQSQEALLSGSSHDASLKQGRPRHKSHQGCRGRLPCQSLVLAPSSGVTDNSPSLGRCRHVLSTAPPFILWWPNLEIPFVPLHRIFYLTGGLRCQPIEKEHRLYLEERTQKAVDNVRCMFVFGCRSCWLFSIEKLDTIFLS